MAARRRALGWGVVVACVTLCAWTRAQAAGELAGPDLAQAFALQVLASGDHHGLPFAVVDKHAARIVIHHADGTLAGATRVLLGSRRGDDSLPGVGERTQQRRLRPQDQTTPAGRFVSHPGRNASGEEVIWVDYGAAVSMHRVRIVDPKEHRLERLAAGAAEDRRLSYGCINIPVAFFDAVMKPKA